MTSAQKEFETYAIEAFGLGNVLSFRDLKTCHEEWSGKTVSDSTFRVTLHRMKKKGAITPVKRGWYKIEPEQRVILPVGDEEKKIYTHLESEFPFAEWVVWSSSFFDRFASFQSVKEYHFLEMENGSEESAFYLLQEYYSENLFLKPDEEIWSNYVVKVDKPLIIKTLISESPVEKSGGIPVPAIEKVLVDLFADELYFQPWLGERDRIMRGVFEVTTINLSVLMRYASRRNRKPFFKEYILKHELVKPELLEDL
ncbi:hypothetical protein BH23BAC3_BH23BAC3_28030 [soil metagenome]